VKCAQPQGVFGPSLMAGPAGMAVIRHELLRAPRQRARRCQAVVQSLFQPSEQGIARLYGLPTPGNGGFRPRKQGLTPLPNATGHVMMATAATLSGGGHWSSASRGGRAAQRKENAESASDRPGRGRIWPVTNHLRKSPYSGRIISKQRTITAIDMSRPSDVGLPSHYILAHPQGAGPRCGGCLLAG